MKLTDEQRELIIKRLSYIESNNLFDAFLINDMKTLLSTEQAWKEAAEQAIEVLKHYGKDPVTGNHARFVLQKMGIQATVYSLSQQEVKP